MYTTFECFPNVASACLMPISKLMFCPSDQHFQNSIHCRVQCYAGMNKLATHQNVHRTLFSHPSIIINIQITFKFSFNFFLTFEFPDIYNDYVG